MAVIRTTRFTVDPTDVETMRARRRRLLDAVRAAFSGPTEARLVRLDGDTWLDSWRWDSVETLRAALDGAPGLPEAGAAFAVTRDATAEQGEVVDEEVGTEPAITVTPVGRVRNGRTDPQDSDGWGDVESTIVVEPRFGDRCLTGLDGFSHVEMVFFFDRLPERADYRQPLRPRGRVDLPEVGVFADRGPRRPNRIGCTICEIVSVDGRELRVRGLDAVDGTAVLDIKPVMRQFLPRHIRQPGWVDSLMKDYFDAVPVDRP